MCTWKAGKYGTSTGTDVTVEEADAQILVESFLSPVDILMEYAAGGDSNGLDTRRILSWLNIGRSFTALRTLPCGINLGHGISFTSGTGKREDDLLSLFGRNPVVPIRGAASVAQIDQQLFQVCKDTSIMLGVK